jgi:hypothetical protein
MSLSWPARTVLNPLRRGPAAPGPIIPGASARQVAWKRYRPPVTMHLPCISGASSVYLPYTGQPQYLSLLSAPAGTTHDGTSLC